MAAMTLGEERIGVLQVSNKTNGSTFTMEDIRLLEIYARQAAIVVESARLYAEEQSRVAELQGLQQIVAAMSAVSNLLFIEMLFGFNASESAFAFLKIQDGFEYFGTAKIWKQNGRNVNLAIRQLPKKKI